MWLVMCSIKKCSFVDMFHLIMEGRGENQCTSRPPSFDPNNSAVNRIFTDTAALQNDNSDLYKNCMSPRITISVVNLD